MKIGIPALLNTSFNLFLIGVSFYSWVEFFDYSLVSNFPKKETIMYIVLWLLGPVIVLLSAKRFKLVLLKREKMIMVYPLLFRKKSYKYSEVKRVDWSTHGGGRSVEYLRMNIVFKSRETIFISNQGLENFSSIEKSILKSLKRKPSLLNRRRLVKEQAKANLFYCILGVLVFGVITISSLNLSNNIYLMILSFLVFIRMLSYLFNCIKAIKNNV